jgi:hypothetical protein
MSAEVWLAVRRAGITWIASYAGFGAIALWLIWSPGEMAIERLYLASTFAVVVYGAFFIALLGMPVYGGRAYDDNGYQPFAVGRMKWDANVTAFSVMAALLTAGAVLVAIG